MWRKIGFSVLKIAAYVLMFAGLATAVMFAAQAGGGQGFFSKPPYRVAFEIGMAFAAVAPALFMGLVIERWRFDSLGYDAHKIEHLLFGTVIGAAIMGLPVLLLLLFGAARYTPDLSGFSGAGLALGLIICFFNVVSQQAVFRSYVFQELWAKYGAWVAGGVTTALFVLAHFPAFMIGGMGFVLGLNILLAGILMSVAYVRTGALWLVMGIHLGWNGLMGPVLGINVTGMDISYGHWSFFSFPGNPLFTGGVMGVEGGLAGLIGPPLGLWLVLRLFKQRPKPDFSKRKQ